MEDIEDVVKVVAMTWKAKKVVNETMDAINGYFDRDGDSSGGNKSDNSDERASSVSMPDFL